MKVKKAGFISLLLIVIFLIIGCNKQPLQKELSVTRTNFLMGTIVTVKVYGTDREKVADEVIDEIQRLEELMSLQIKDSEINRVNSEAGIKPVAVSADTFHVVKTAYEYAQKTAGLFDPSIGPLVNLWGIGTKNAEIPKKEEIKKAMQLVNYKNILLDEKKMTIFLSKPGMILDVGGIAKGYAADKAVEIFQHHNVSSAYVSIGGNVVVHGRKPDKSLWKIGIQDPRSERGQMMGIVSVADLAVVTSGDYERFFIRDGLRYHHILNPQTGYPVETDLISASIIGSTSLRADALSTCVFLLGTEQGKRLAAREGFDFILVTKGQQVSSSTKLTADFEIIDEEYVR